MGYFRVLLAHWLGFPRCGQAALEISRNTGRFHADIDWERKSIMIRILLVSFLALPQVCHAQCRECRPSTLFSWEGQPEALGELGSISTDRPDFTEASNTVGLGVTQWELGYTLLSDGESQSSSWGEPLLRLGLFANWFELRLAVSPSTIHTRPVVSGLEDLNVGAKLALTTQREWLPEVAIVPQLSLPTGSSEFSSQRVLPGTILLYGWEINETWSLGGSTQYNLAVDDSLMKYDEWAQSLAIGRTLSEAVGTYFEWFAFSPHGTPNVRATHYLDGGFTYLLSGDLQLDIRAGKGLSRTSSDFFVGAGISIRFK
jgi:hypothetical protein